MRHVDASQDSEDPFLVRCLAVRYPAGHWTPRHAHPWGQVALAMTGSITVETSEGHWVLPAGRALWVPPNQEHRLGLRGQARLRTLYLAPWLPRARREQPSTCAVWSVSPLLREIVARVVAAGGLRREEPRHARLAEVLLDEIEGLEQAPVQLPLPVEERALRLAQQMIAEPENDGTLQQLVQGSGASLRTMERLFREQTGLSLGRWRRQARLLYSLERLGEGASVEACARETGYASASAFIALFQREFGVSPGRFFQGSL